MATSRILQNPQLYKRIPPLPIVAALVAVYLIWGSTYLGAAFALESYPPFLLTALRLLVCVVILSVAILIRGEYLPPRREMINATFIGTLLFTSVAMVALGQEFGVASGLASLADAAVVIWAMIFASFFGQRPGRIEMLGSVIGIAGVALLNLEVGMQANPRGALILMLGPAVWAFGSIIGNRIAMPKGIMAVVFQMAGGCCALTLISLLRGEQLPSSPTLAASAALIYLTLVGSLLGFSSYLYLVHRVRPALATSYGYVNPVVAVLLGVSLHGESITQIGILAMIVIITGVVLVMFGKSR